MSVTGGSPSLRRAKGATFECMSGRRERRRWLRLLLDEWWRSGSGVLVHVVEKHRTAAGTLFHDEEETGVTAATRNRSGRSRMLAQIFIGRRG
ncbi:hypothetical protein V6N13_096856 [Hibiscus sabdariffa]|uniref:Uncharacterized protein n=1 Tax=Hibiscus sabdariffa TaxID=183260 RepID=A0ABR2C934_9ROSI